jgi:signal transduction histidine kinase
MQDKRKTKGQLIAEMGELRQRLIIFEQEQQKLKQGIIERQRAEKIMHARLRLLKFAESHSLEEFTQATLDESEALTNSTIGFYHLVEADQRTLSLQTWSTNTLQHMCTAKGKGQHYDIAEAGVWVDCVHQRRPVIHNHYEALPYRRGMPPGHAPVVRELVVPIFRANKIVAIIGVGNKPSDYDEWDVEMVSLLGDLSWDITERQRAEEKLKQAHAELELRVVERTSELRQTVEQLLWEVEERQQTEKALRESEKKLHTLTSQLLTAQEEERKRLSRELHDSLGQTLMVLKLQMRAIEKRLRPDQQALRQESEQTLRQIDRIIEDVRRLARNLSPSVLENLGLAVALRNLCEEFSRYQNLKLSLDMCDISESFSPESQSHIYRIFQESLTNIGKYAQASRVSLAIKRRDGGVAFVIEDDGIGFQLEEVQARDGAERAMGLEIMAERVRILGGELQISSKLGAATKISFIIPEGPQI